MDIEQIVFQRKTAFSFPFLFKISMDTGKYLLTFTKDEGNADSYYSIYISPSMVFDFFHHLFHITDDWKEEYSCGAKLDGGEWNLFIQYLDGSFKKFLGHSSYPINFQMLEGLIDSMIQSALRSEM